MCFTARIYFCMQDGHVAANYKRTCFNCWHPWNAQCTQRCGALPPAVHLTGCFASCIVVLTMYSKTLSSVLMGCARCRSMAWHGCTGTMPVKLCTSVVCYQHLCRDLCSWRVNDCHRGRSPSFHVIMSRCPFAFDLLSAWAGTVDL
jgi:hypothetical protein